MKKVVRHFSSLLRGTTETSQLSQKTFITVKVMRKANLRFKCETKRGIK